MNPKWLNFRNVNGIPYYMNEEGNWVSQFNGIVLTEQELSNIQSQGMMYMDDGWDTPPEDIHVLTVDGMAGLVAGICGGVFDAYPARPRNHFKDYNCIEIEVTGRGGDGAAGDAFSQVAGDEVLTKAGSTHGAGGGGAGGYGRMRFTWDRAHASDAGQTIGYVLGSTYSVAYMNGFTGYGITAHQGQASPLGTTGGLGGTAHIGGGSGGGKDLIVGLTVAGPKGSSGSTTKGGDGGRAYYEEEFNVVKVSGVPGVGGGFSSVTRKGQTAGSGGGGGFTTAVGTGHEALTGVNAIVAGGTYGSAAGGSQIRIIYRFV